MSGEALREVLAQHDVDGAARLRGLADGGGHGERDDGGKAPAPAMVVTEWPDACCLLLETRRAAATGRAHFAVVAANIRDGRGGDNCSPWRMRQVARRGGAAPRQAGRVTPSSVASATRTRAGSSSVPSSSKSARARSKPSRATAGSPSRRATSARARSACELVPGARALQQQEAPSRDGRRPGCRCRRTRRAAGARCPADGDSRLRDRSPATRLRGRGRSRPRRAEAAPPPARVRTGCADRSVAARRRTPGSPRAGRRRPGPVPS